MVESKDFSRKPSKFKYFSSPCKPCINLETKVKVKTILLCGIYKCGYLQSPRPSIDHILVFLFLALVDILFSGVELFERSDRRHDRKVHFCEIILNLEQQVRRYANERFFYL